MSKPNSPKSPKSPKDAKEGAEKPKAFDLGELMQRLDEAVAKTIEDFSELFVAKYMNAYLSLKNLVNLINPKLQKMVDCFLRTFL